MAVPFANRPPTENELTKLTLFFSTFRDGSGNEREKDGSTRASWRQIERCFAEWLDAIGGEDKAIFDVVAADQQNTSIFYGFSIKSKMLSKKNFESLDCGGRVYMEIANSPAKFWDEIYSRTGFREDSFRNQLHAQEIGSIVLALVERWHAEGKNHFERVNAGMTLDLNSSCYLCVSYSDEKKSSERMYQIHSFPLCYPNGIIWKYQSESCLRGFDPNNPTEALLDWYGVSGGQLKYYPSTTMARFSSPQFSLLSVTPLTLTQKAKSLFPDRF